MLRSRGGLVRRRLIADPGEPDERLHGFAEAHVIGQNSAEPAAREARQEMESLELVRPQLGRDAERQRGRLVAAHQLLEAAAKLRELRGVEKGTERGIRQLQRMEPLRPRREILGIEPELREARLHGAVDVQLQPPPALALEAHVISPRPQQQFQLRRRELGVLDVEIDVHVEPIGRADVAVRRRMQIKGQLRTQRSALQRGELRVGHRGA